MKGGTFCPMCCPGRTLETNRRDGFNIIQLLEYNTQQYSHGLLRSKQLQSTAKISCDCSLSTNTSHHVILSLVRLSFIIQNPHLGGTLRLHKVFSFCIIRVTHLIDLWSTGKTFQLSKLKKAPIISLVMQCAFFFLLGLQFADWI